MTGHPGSAGFQPARKNHPLATGWRSRGYLPHFDHAHNLQVISYHLADSLPLTVATELASRGDPEKRQRYEAYLDAGHGSCLLRHEPAARIVQDGFQFFDRERYNLLAWVVMPNHVHVLIEQLQGYSLADIVHSWKRHTAQEINRLYGLGGPLWQREYWDRFIRDERHYRLAVQYIEANPVKAGLAATAAQWRWSSAPWLSG